MRPPPTKSGYLELRAGGSAQIRPSRKVDAKSDDLESVYFNELVLHFLPKSLI